MQKVKILYFCRRKKCSTIKYLLEKIYKRSRNHFSMGLRDSQHSTVQRAIVNFFATFERELSEIEDLLLRVLTPKNKETILAEIREKLDLIYRGLDVFIEDEKDNLSRGEKAEVQLLQRHVLNLKLSLESKSILELIALLQSLHKQLRLVLD